MRLKRGWRLLFYTKRLSIVIAGLDPAIHFF
jgi:hypothetical protein